MRISDWRSDVCSADLPYCLSALPNALVQPLAPISSTPSSLPLSMPSRRAHHEAEKLCAKIVTMTTANPKDCRSRAPMKPKSARSEEHTSELQSLMRTSYAVYCLTKKKKIQTHTQKRTRHRQH